MRQRRRKGGRYARKNAHDLRPADRRGAQEAVADLRRLRLAGQRGGPGNDRRRYHPPAPPQELHDLYVEINHIGNNINQIARKANAGFATKEDVRELKFLMRTIEAKMAELVKR